MKGYEKGITKNPCGAKLPHKGLNKKQSLSYFKAFHPPGYSLAKGRIMAKKSTFSIMLNSISSRKTSNSYFNPSLHLAKSQLLKANSSSSLHLS